jgi:hypothetical protein
MANRLRSAGYTLEHHVSVALEGQYSTGTPDLKTLTSHRQTQRRETIPDR